MRLINAEKLLNDLKKNALVNVNQGLEEVIKAQPTAFDLDKVLEDLEEYAYSKDICSRHNGCPYGDDEEIECANCAAIGALEIVKGGGRDRI